MDTIDQTGGEPKAAGNLTADPEAAELAVNEEILQQRRKQLAKDPRNVALLNELGQAAENAGDADRAVWAFKRAIRLDPDYAPSYRNLGLLYRGQGREEQAVETLQQYARRAGPGAQLPVEMAGVVERKPAGTTGAKAPAQQATVRQGRETAPKIARQVDETPIYNQLDKVWNELGLTPAEAMMLLDPENSNGISMMQTTLFDLVARGVLEADERLRIGRGEQYGKTALAPHEALFAKYFSRISDYVDVDKLARAALVELNNNSEVFKTAYVRGSLVKKGYLVPATRRIAGILPVPYAALSKKGAMARNRLQHLLVEADRHLARTLATDPQQASAYVDRGGPALLLVDGYPSQKFKQWHEMLTRMGFGPAMTKLKGKAQKSSLVAYIDDMLKALLGE
jgi:tetratricopeptide (TPR) repeat protein